MQITMRDGGRIEFKKPFLLSRSRSVVGVCMEDRKKSYQRQLESSKRIFHLGITSTVRLVSVTIPSNSSWDGFPIKQGTNSHRRGKAQKSHQQGKLRPPAALESTNHGRDRTARREGKWAADWSHGLNSGTRITFQRLGEPINHKLCKIWTDVTYWPNNWTTAHHASKKSPLPACAVGWFEFRYMIQMEVFECRRERFGK